MPSSTPSGWADHQRAFHVAYLEGTGQFPTCAVHWRAIDGVGAGLGPAAGLATALVRAASRVLRHRMVNDADVIAVWPATAPAGAPAELIFEFSGTPPGREGEGVVIGELTANGALVLLADSGAELWPVYNPRRPTFLPPGR